MATVDVVASHADRDRGWSDWMDLGEGRAVAPPVDELLQASGEIVQASILVRMPNGAEFMTLHDTATNHVLQRWRALDVANYPTLILE